MSRFPVDCVKPNGSQPEVAGHPDRAIETMADVEETEWIVAERRERQARQAPDLPDRAFERITPQV